MLFDAIAVDVFNLYHKKKVKAGPTVISMANEVINFIETELVPKLNEKSDLKKVYLLFDPLPENDGGISKSFKFFLPASKTTRKQILRKYKTGRAEDKMALDTLQLVKMYYAFRGKTYAIIMSPYLEADDYVEPIVQSNPGKKILLFSSDMDWSRYISADVLMCTGNPSELFGVEEFSQKFGYLPSVTSVTVYKALHGDPSDGIPSAITPEKARNCLPCEELALTYASELANSREALDDVLYRVKKYTFRELFALKNRNTEQELFYRMVCNDEENMVRNFLQNVQVIRSRCKSISEYAASRNYDKSFCDAIDRTLGRGGEPQKKPFSFGKIKLS